MRNKPVALPQTGARGCGGDRGCVAGGEKGLPLLKSVTQILQQMTTVLLAYTNMKLRVHGCTKAKQTSLMLCKWAFMHIVYAVMAHSGYTTYQSPSASV